MEGAENCKFFGNCTYKTKRDRRKARNTTTARKTFLFLTAGKLGLVDLLGFLLSRFVVAVAAAVNKEKTPQSSYDVRSSRVSVRHWISYTAVRRSLQL
jgi:hypothetical protein